MLANRTAHDEMQGVAPALLPPVNVLRLSLHPGGGGAPDREPRQWRAHLFHPVAPSDPDHG